MKGKVLAGCVICAYCANRATPKAYPKLTSSDMVILGFSGCKLDGNNRLVDADRKCLGYKGVSNGSK